MTEELANEIAVKRRIIGHMNADHQDSLVRYLEHYARLSSFAARNAHLEDLSFDAMTISASGAQHVVPIYPPLSSWSETRARTVAMEEDTIKALQRSKITVKTYAPPRGPGLVLAIFIAWTTVTMLRRSNFLPGSSLHEYLYKYIPGYTKLNYDWQPYVLPFILVTHSAEVLFLMIPMLQRHSVPTGSRLWFKWVANNLAEGFPAIRRFNKLVKAEEYRMANLKR